MEKTISEIHKEQMSIMKESKAKKWEYKVNTDKGVLNYEYHREKDGSISIKGGMDNTVNTKPVEKEETKIKINEDIKE